MGRGFGFFRRGKKESMVEEVPAPGPLRSDHRVTTFQEWRASQVKEDDQGLYVDIEAVEPEPEVWGDAERQMTDPVDPEPDELPHLVKAEDRLQGLEGEPEEAWSIRLGGPDPVERFTEWSHLNRELGRLEAEAGKPGAAAQEATRELAASYLQSIEARTEEVVREREALVYEMVQESDDLHVRIDGLEVELAESRARVEMLRSAAWAARLVSIDRLTGSTGWEMDWEKRALSNRSLGLGVEWTAKGRYSMFDLAGPVRVKLFAYGDRSQVELVLETRRKEVRRRLLREWLRPDEDLGERLDGLDDDVGFMETAIKAGIKDLDGGPLWPLTVASRMDMETGMVHPEGFPQGPGLSHLDLDDDAGWGN